MGRYTGKKCRIVIMFWFTLMFFIMEITTGYNSNSMALIADSFHMLSDVVALLITFLSIKMAPKRWAKNTYGCARAEVLGALINAVFLAALCFSITVEAIKRFFVAEEIIDARYVLYVGISGLLVNIIGLFLFHEHGHSHPARKIPSVSTNQQLKTPTKTSTKINSVANLEEIEILDNFINPIDKNLEIHPGNKGHSHDSTHLNMHGMFLHIMADALGSIIVIISAVVVCFTDWQYRFYLDPALSLVLVFIISLSLWPLLRDSSLILLQTVPDQIQLERLERNLTKIDGIISVHELHLWQLTGDRLIATVHIRCKDIIGYMKTAESVKNYFHNEGVHSITIQPEFHDETALNIPHSHADIQKCLLNCPKTGPPCIQATCCGPMNISNKINAQEFSC